MFRSNKIFFRLIVALLVAGLSFYLGIKSYFPYTSVKFNFNTPTIRELRPQIEKVANLGLLIETGEKPIILQAEEIRNWIESYTRNYSGKKDLRVSTDKIVDYLESVSPLLNVEPVNAKFVINNGRAETFQTAVRGKRLKIAESTSLLTSSIINGKTSAALLFDEIEPEITLDKLNNLGITTLLGKGESDYGSSPSSRIHNIKVGMSKFNGIILKPGEMFSFNDYLGEIDERNGYQSELVIKRGKLIYEYGGGLCQVATTVFRAAITSGLEITERKPHSFAVQYYNPQGFDATIYPGVVDLKFVNNTNDHVLIQTKLVGSKLEVEIYGSANNRKIGLEGPFQYDQKPNGSMRAYFVRKIYDGDNLEKEERFDSKYNSPPPREKNPLE